MRQGNLPETKDLRVVALERCRIILSQAREAGEQNKGYVLKAVKAMSYFYHDPQLVTNLSNNVLLRLQRKRVMQLLNGSVFELPDSKLLKGSISIGNVIGNNAPVALTLRNVNENIGIC